MQETTPTAEVVAFLARPDAYPRATREVSVIETHLSWVFLTDDRAYKLKKPVLHEGLDLRSLESRRRNSEEELRLNRRLAPDVYLETTPLTRSAAGLRLGGPGRVVDWLVVMVRLPAEDMLERRILDGRVDEVEVRAFARRLATFYGAAAPAGRTGPEHRRVLERGLEADRLALLEPDNGLDRARVERVCAALLATLVGSADLFDRRAAEGRLVEGHGDLRPEHIALGPTPTVIDCLEFDRELRLVDPADELAFLALECERLGAPAIGGWVIDEYEAHRGDRPPPEVVGFYRGYRACRRARLAARRLSDPRADVAKWRGRARWYLGAALGSPR